MILWRGYFDLNFWINGIGLKIGVVRNIRYVKYRVMWMRIKE